MKKTIVLFPGDGIGPEVLDSAAQVLAHVAEKFAHEFHFERHLIGGASIDAHQTPLTEAALSAAKAADAVLLGAVGGPKWDDPNAKTRPEQGLLQLRKGLEVYANIRPVRAYDALLDKTPLKPAILAGVDIVVMRELTGGLYFGEKRREFVNGVERSFDALEYQDFEIRRIVKMAFAFAAGRRKKVTSIDKANVLESSRLWRKIVDEMALSFPDVSYSHMLVDAAAMKLITAPSQFDVIVTENMFGDILTDEASVLSGSMGLLPSASIGDGKSGLYEPIHGSAPDIAGKGIANPIGAILSAALMLRYSFQLEEEAQAIEKAAEAVINHGDLTPDLGGSGTTKSITERIIQAI